MTFVMLDPNSTGANTGAVTGTNAHSALSDGSDSTFVDFDYGEAALLGLTDLSLPAGAVLVSAQAWARVEKLATAPGGLFTSLIADSTETSTVGITWDSPDFTGGAFAWGGLTDSGLDGAILGVGCQSLTSLRVYKAWIRVQYLTQPTVNVTAPTGTVTAGGLSVAWVPSFDAHAWSSPSFWEVKVFSSAQYGAGGFDPSTSTPTLFDAGEDGATSKQFTEMLADGSYRAYVRVAAGNSPDQWSSWDYEGFTVSISRPGVPSISAVANTADGCIVATVDDTSGSASTDYFEIQHTGNWADGWTNVRTELGDGRVAATGSPVDIPDFEAPSGSFVDYRVRAVHAGTSAYSDWNVLSGPAGSMPDEWLKCVLNPALNVKVTVRSYQGFDVPSNQGVFRGLGQSVATVVSDVPGPEQGSIVVFSKSESDRDALTALLASASPVFLQVPGQPDRVVKFGDRSSVRVIDRAAEQWHEETLAWTVVDSPDGPYAL